ncbi:hypothetical protein ACEYZD_003032 [Klebsiella aerogenes]|uniref:hypothetical protein n=1 Tax=Klebsiella aerogenes TaxID=548 RepID=UPI0013DDB467|nr:hypothetical protein [Klebsiella aerogenes]HBY1220629.1 hypothetical protein [Klebsiella aerogenes]HBY9708566.1 hypothetical protein [Klebsiella aerogenes]
MSMITPIPARWRACKARLIRFLERRAWQMFFLASGILWGLVVLFSLLLWRLL